VTSSRGRSLALGDRLVVSLGTAKRLPSAKDSILSTDARTSKAFSDGHMFLSIDLRDAFLLLIERGKGQPIFLIIRKG